ncbi:hypothetical protein OUZ56_006213 [Daphnia magna]|uniref:Uncharacterized protein n=1 Tax=Daphnia magna TaxID=35525 RepID=A0ABQ9YWB7_9CRUS|nr:hypothetical protein OUZ56_006213 [Daphnia magna]
MPVQGNSGLSSCNQWSTRTLQADNGTQASKLIVRFTIPYNISASRDDRVLREVSIALTFTD